MSQENSSKEAAIKSALIGAVLSVLCGLLLWWTPLGDAWTNKSYDYLFHFGSRSLTNQVALILMDNASYDALHQSRTAIWNRSLHTQLLKKLTDDGARLVIFDVLFRDAINPQADLALAGAIRKNGGVLLVADNDSGTQSKLGSMNVVLPHEMFLQAAAGYGIGHVDEESYTIARHHWPFFTTNETGFHSLGWAAAEKYAAKLDGLSDQQWLRYYNQNGPWETVSYHSALSNAPGFFKDKVVFIGNWPNKPNDPGALEIGNDKFRTPYTSAEGKAVGGMAVIATMFLNLVNADSLQRFPLITEAVIVIIAGILIGAGLCFLKPIQSLAAALGIFLLAMFIFISLSYRTNYWFPWLVIAGGQLPCALAWSWVGRKRHVTVFNERFPGYASIGEPFGKGGYGKVWLVRNALGHLQALKEIEMNVLEDNDSYEREFRALQSYKTVSNEHLGLLHIDHLNRNDEAGYFYYVMELGDPLDPEWEEKGDPYRPRDLTNVCRVTPSGRLPARECLRIGIGLLDALNFLHQHNLVHRDIKPSNIIFVNDRPKLADVGLLRKASDDVTQVGTPYYMPPVPEAPGTMIADIYAMGKVLYVISSGKKAEKFSELSTTLVTDPEFMELNPIICRACQPDTSLRYSSVAEMLSAMRAAQAMLDAGQTKRV